MATTVIRFPKTSESSYCYNGLSLKRTGSVVTVSEDSFVFELESRAKSLALLLFDTPASSTWSEQDKASLTALIAFVNKNGMNCVSVGLRRAVLKGQIKPGDVIQQLVTKRDGHDPETREEVKGESVLITPKREKHIRRVLKYLTSHDYLIELSVTVPRHSVPRTVKMVDVTGLRSLNLSGTALVQGIDWDDFVLGKLSRFHRLQHLDLSKNGLGRSACDALATMLSRDGCNLQSLYLKDNRLDDGCVEVLTSNLRANTKLMALELRRNYLITSHGKELLFQLLGGRDTPTATYNSNHTLTKWEMGNIEGGAKVLLAINCFYDRSRVFIARQKIWHVHYRAKQFDVGPFLGLEVGVMPYLLDWFGVTEDRKRGYRFKETITKKKTPFDDVKKRFNIFYQLVRNWNVETLLGHLSPDRARIFELEGQVASKDEEIRALKCEVEGKVASMGEEIRALKCEIVRIKKENQELSSGTGKRKRVS
mmetsp:Transcript_7230/g.16807  ORF Transcript_7230/g.16807 Transcript_7230/m.16807 type:complete len:480 (-) Transcript_7230:53-1492(-)